MMFYYDNRQHNLPHIHVRYQDSKAVFAIETAEMFEGSLPNKQVRLVQAWMEIHKDELMADWELAVSGEQPFRIDPLK